MAGKRGVLRFTQRDVARAFRAAKSAGVTVRVDILPNGELSVVPVNGALSVVPVNGVQEPQEQHNEWDQALGKPAPKVRSRV
jgi:hypothetical protein